MENTGVGLIWREYQDGNDLVCGLPSDVSSLVLKNGVRHAPVETPSHADVDV